MGSCFVTENCTVQESISIVDTPENFLKKASLLAWFIVRFQLLLSLDFVCFELEIFVEKFVYS
jgi:hypothetical protein